jgi:enoyl-CoA hydratase
VNVRYEPRERIAVVTIDRPERRNAVDTATAAELVAAFERFDADPRCDVAILTGAGGTFCAGADLRSVAAGDLSQASNGTGPMGPTRMVLGKPVIAAIEGFAVGGGFELALWCDLRVAASDANFGFLNRRFGIPLIDLGSVRLPRLIGQSVAMDLILTGRQVNAIEGKRIGLVNRIAPAGEALNAALSLAADLVALPQAGLRSDRLSALEQWDLNFDEACANEARRGAAALVEGDVSAAARRFIGSGDDGDGPGAGI